MAETTTTGKKGRKPNWRPAARLGHLRVPPGFVPRWCSSDEADMQRKLAEGWIPVNRTTVPSGEHVRKEAVTKEVFDGENPYGAIGYREMIGMMLPEEMKAARDEYHREESLHQLRSKVMGKEKAEEKLGRYKDAIIGGTMTIN